jgi:hypothetical protein
MFRGSEQMVVVGVDLTEAVFLGTGKVEGVGGAEEDGSRKLHCDAGGRVLQGLLEGEPLEQSRLFVGFDLPPEMQELGGIQRAFPELAVKHEGKFHPTERQAKKLILIGGTIPYRLGSLFGEINFCEIRGVKVHHQSPPLLRSSETAWVLSVPAIEIFNIRAYSGHNTRFFHFGRGAFPLSV